MFDEATSLFWWTVLCTLDPCLLGRGIMFLFEKFTFASYPHAGILLAGEDTHSFNKRVGGVFNSFVHSLEHTFIHSFIQLCTRTLLAKPVENNTRYDGCRGLLTNHHYQHM